MNFLRPPSLHFRRVVLAGVVCLLATVLTGVFVAADNDDHLPSASATTALRAPGTTRIAEQFGALPLSFEINKGQVDQSVKFLSHGPGYDLFLTATEAVLRLRKPRTLQVEKLKDQALGKTGTEMREGTVLRLKMLGAKATPQAEGQEELPGRANYFTGNDQSKWRRNVPTYRRAYFKDIYPGIDLVYYGKQRQLEYDLVVAPSADPKLIRFTVEGADQIRVDKTGRLLLALKYGEVSLNKPVSYQLDENGSRREVKAGYVLNGNEVRFKLERFDPSKPLIIDPVLIYSTLLGSLGADNSFGIAVDPQGSAYITGTTDNPTFPTTPGAFKTTIPFGGGAFVSKLDPTGSTLVYSTYLGGGSGTRGLGIAVDSAGNAHVTGTTNSTDFPLVNSLKTTSSFFKTTDAAANWNNLNSGMVGSVNVLAVAPSAPNTIYVETSDGIYRSTDAGGTWSKTPATGFGSFGFTNALAVDPTNSTVVYAGNFSGFFRSTNGGNSWTRIIASPLNSAQVMCVVFDPATPATMYVGASTGVFKSTDSGATWVAQNNFGLSGVPNVNALAIDPSAPATIYAGTEGNGLFKSTNAGGLWTAMNNGMGGNNPTFISTVVIDPANPATVYTGHRSGNFGGGINKSTNGGASWTPLTNDVSPNTLIFVMAATPSAVYAATSGGGIIKTTNGGSNWTSANAGLGSTSVHSLVTDPTNAAILYAGTGGSGLPDAFITKLNSSGSGLLFSTLVGGNGEDIGNAISVDGSGNISIAGQTNSTNFPAVNAFRSTVTFNGNCATGFVTKLNPSVSSYVFSTYLGAGQCETVNGLAADNSGNVYVTGRAGPGFPTVNAFQSVLGGGPQLNIDAFVTKFMADGSVVYSTYLGGNDADTGFGIAADSSGNAYITGSTSSSNFPVMNPIQATIGPPQFGSQQDAFVTKLNSQGSALVYSTYLGGTGFEGGRAIAVDSANNAYVTGSGDSVDFPLVAGALRTKSAIHKSTDAAGNWSNDNYGFTGASPYFAGSVVTDLAIHPTQPATVYAGTGNGIFKSTNGGRTWTAINNGLLNRNVVALVINPSNPSILYAATAGSAIGNTGVYKSTDGGDSWNLRSNGISSPNLVSLAIDPVTKNTLYTAFSTGGPGTHLYKTIDGADNWNLVGTQPPSIPGSIAIDPQNHTTLYVADTVSGGGVYKSIDGGTTWQSLGLSGSGARSIAVSPFTSGLVYAGTDQGLYKSVDGGSNWSLIPSVSGKVVFDPVSSSTAYLLSAEFKPNQFSTQRPLGVFKTTDNGQTWVQMNKGIESTVATAMAINPFTSSTLYVAVKPPDAVDVFVTKINPAGSSLIYSTFIGGPLADSVSITSAQPSGIAVDTSGNAYVTGLASSPGFPVTPGSYQPFIRGGNDTFITKLGASYIISGQVLNGITPLGGVEVVVNDGTSLTSVLTESDGSYQFSHLREGGNYTVSAATPHFTMTPASQTFNNLNGDQVLNFNALTSVSSFYTISGQVTENGVALAGVTLTLSGSQSGLRTTDSTGNYSFELIAGGNYTVTPSMVGFNFGPTSQTFNSLSGPQVANFAAARQSFLVTNNNNHGAGSLREAIINANATLGADTITFNIPGPGVKVISLLTALPEITEQVVIDATTQPGYAGTPLIELDGTGAGGSASGLVIRAGGSTVRGLAIGNFHGTAGIWLNGCNNNLIQANYLGIAADGATARQNTRGIVLNNSSNNVIGGTSAGTRNVISGNGTGIDIVGNGNVVQGNFIGTNATGTAAVANNAGVSLSSLSPAISTDNVIGGTAAGAGNLISGNQTGISVNTNATTIQGNLIGTDIAGTSKIPNANGIVATGLNILVGGPTPGARNIISGNSGDGVYLRGAGNKLQGNYVGTDITGTKALGNTGNGVVAGENALIGGTAPEERNIISASGNFSGNVALGVNNSGTSATVQGNYIGTDVTGTRSLGVAPAGINVVSNGNLIGGTVAGARNVISGNGIGIQIGSFSGAGMGNVIQSNVIGLNAPGTGPLPNIQEGIAISNGSNNTIGGTENNAGNTIAFNGSRAISIVTGTGNSVRGNSIFSNNGLAIDLGADGVTPNDVNDADVGPNLRQNFPVITTVLSSANSTTIQGTLNSKPNTTFQIDFYSNAAVNPIGNGDGAQFAGTAPVNTDGNGNATINATFPVGLSPGRVITATATDPSGNTSEFSAADAASATGRVQFTTGVIKVIEDIGMITLTVQRTGGTAGNLTVDYSTADGTAVAGQDYTATAGTLNFSAGETSKTIQIPILDNEPTEPDETFTVSLRNTPTLESLGAPTTTTVTVQDHSISPTINILDLSVVEGNPGTTTDVSFRVEISAATGRPVNGNFATSNLSAFGGASCNDQGVDYESRAGTFSFESGTTQTNILVKVCGDTYAEANETFRVLLSNVSGATVLPSPQGLGTIVNDDVLGLILEESGPSPNQAAALDQLLGLRDPFRIMSIPDWYATGPDRNTRVVLFARNLQLNPGETASAVVVRLQSSTFELFDLPAQDVRPIPGTEFTQVIIRLPDNVSPGTCTFNIRAHTRISNIGTFRIAP